MKLSQTARNILSLAASRDDGIRLTTKTVLMLEDRGAIRRKGQMIYITEYGKRCLACGWFTRSEMR